MQESQSKLIKHTVPEQISHGDFAKLVEELKFFWMSLMTVNSTSNAFLAFKSYCSAKKISDPEYTEDDGLSKFLTEHGSIAWIEQFTSMLKLSNTLRDVFKDFYPGNPTVCLLLSFSFCST